MIRTHAVISGLCIWASALLAQGASTAPAAVIRGTVFDSIAGRPLSGASVEVAAVRSTHAPWTTTTDSAGQYRVSGLPAGQYTVGFYHDALTTLGLDAVTRTIDVTADTDARVDLAIPSSAMVRALRCGKSDEYAQGMLVGFVRDAENQAAIAGTKATVFWRAFALDSANYRVVKEQTTATITDDGMLLACHLPIDAPLDLLVTAPGHRSVEGTVITVPPGGIARVELLLADSSATSGAAVIRGRVTRMSGKAVESGRVVIKALGREVAVRNGEFMASDMPAGTWVAEARVIGVEPQDVLVTATQFSVATANITVSNGPQRLDAVTVIGKPTRDLLVLDDVLRRSRVGMGTTFLPGHPALRSATFTSDVMKEARGFRWVNPDSVTVVGRGGCTAVAVYVNDVRQPDMMRGLDHLAPVNEVLAVETWSDIAWAPIQYRPSNLGGLTVGPQVPGQYLPSAPPLPSPRACALVLVWTRRHF
ncbi:MAG: carboxypeptidase regulatory-like domain-containing protein [Gemmatimonadaceae bacterium]